MKLTDFLAIYGAVLSTLVFAWTAFRAKPIIKVKVTYASDTVEGSLQVGVGIAVQNPSSHTAHIANLSILYPFKSVSIADRLKHIWRFKTLPSRIGYCATSLTLIGVDDRCPVSIEPGQSHLVFISNQRLAEVASRSTDREFIASVQDALWRNKYSKPFRYDLPGFLEVRP